MTCVIEKSQPWRAQVHKDALERSMCCSGQNTGWSRTRRHEASTVIWNVLNVQVSIFSPSGLVPGSDRPALSWLQALFFFLLTLLLQRPSGLASVDAEIPLFSPHFSRDSVSILKHLQQLLPNDHSVSSLGLTTCYPQCHRTHYITLRLRDFGLS